MKSSYLFLFTVGIFVASTGAYADKLDSDGILRSDDGRIRRMKWLDAMEACPQGTRLPTIREFAKLSQASGAKGILEVSQVNPNDGVPEGYLKVSVLNNDLQTDEFYFNYEGYKRPSGDLGNNWFWSSCVHDGYSDGGCGLSGYLGLVYFTSRDYVNGAVRCVVGQ